ncbi:polysaccharide deacetylase family protein [Sphingomonas donggukensis]|uniref:Polysaccharide deacetylase family protein n=1 Tax=Sphingomonas donggukensis TaxID=2949093 RepID=A0ABY4U2M0_9SPHN|nr:polysaccharide deacetylase family protein [Sphingomonas donggukensis]URW76798.1 polysaccharide deacetylase family protein [Sphingomonas donggukensis]
MEARPPFRPAVPAPGARLCWPAEFGRRYTIFVDTEEEFDWDAPFRRDATGVTATAAIPDAAARFTGLGAPLTYLVDHPVATDPRAVAAIARALEDGRSAVGTQLHPWVNPPFDEAVTPANSFVGNLPPALEAAKLDVLTAAIAQAFGRRPVSYRAGRYGLGTGSTALLADRGYRIDTSMRARYDFTAKGGPDYRAIGNDAFRVDGLVELPLTTIFTGVARRGGEWLHALAGRIPRGTGLLARAGLLNRVALTPEDMPQAEALEAVRVAVGEGLALLNLSFHSPSLVPGHTPYVRDARDLAAFWGWWDAVLGLLDRLGVRSASEADILDACAVANTPVSTDHAGGL